MSKKPPHASKPLEPSETDDLKLINGIGPAVENRLHGVGIFSFAQLAALSPADIAAAVLDLSGLSAERIIKQDWIGQARKLATKSTLTEAQKEAKASMVYFHKATFTIELSLDEDNAVNNTHILHIQSGDEKSWTDWTEAELIDFLVQHAELKLPLAEPAIAIESVKTVPATPLKEKIEPVAPEFVETTLAAPIASTSRVAAEAVPIPPVATKLVSVGVLRICEMEIVKANNHGSHSFLRQGEPFQVQFTLDLAEALVPGNTPLTYKASIYAKSLGGQKRQTVNEARGKVMPTEKITINVQDMTLPLGLYRLEAVVSLASKESARHPELIAGIVGGLVQVY